VALAFWPRLELVALVWVTGWFAELLGSLFLGASFGSVGRVEQLAVCFRLPNARHPPGLTTTTGQGAWRITASATLPISALVMPPTMAADHDKVGLPFLRCLDDVRPGWSVEDERECVSVSLQVSVEIRHQTCRI
jgi:hypothetical protein